MPLEVVVKRADYDMISFSIISDAACSKKRLMPSKAPLTMAKGKRSGMNIIHCKNMDELNFFIMVEANLQIGK